MLWEHSGEVLNADQSVWGKGYQRRLSGEGDPLAESSRIHRS